jgi:hypothetical protein
MPQPEGNQLSFGFSGILTTVAINYLPDLTQFIGQSLLPDLPVAAAAGAYNIWKQGDFLRRQGKTLANYEAAPMGGYSSGQGTYKVSNWALATPYTNRDIMDAVRGGQTPQQFRNNKTRFIVTQGVLEQEFRVKTLIQTTANWGTTIAGVQSGSDGVTQFIRWDQAASTPVDDIDLWKRRMRLMSGFTPNTLVIPELVWLQLKKNAQVIARITPGFYGAGKAAPVEVSVDQLKALFGIPNIYIPVSVYNSAQEGQPDVLTDIWSNTMWLGYVNATPSPDTPSAAYNMAWTGDNVEGLPAGMTTADLPGPQMMGATKNESGIFMRQFPDVPRGAMVIEGQIFWSPNVVAPTLGMTWTAPIG